ncbi:MAG: hypothetical protein E6L09_10095 [Verrucomicrobia bacterium]|nr:MAG: hypothetical protein E6L09_10095 [Verrucomicrobiota bacterium]
MREEPQLAVRERRVVGVGIWKPQETRAGVFVACNEQDALPHSAPGIGLGAAVISEHYDADAGFPGRFERLLTGAFGVVGIFCVDVGDGAEVFVDA